MIINILLLIVGFLLLIKGADWFVSGASALARKYHVSDLAIGLTIVAFGTSAPELVVNAFASATDHQSIVFGNVIGSNLMNLLLILGLVGIISPVPVQSSTVWKEIPLSLLAIILLFFMSNDYIRGTSPLLGRSDALVLLGMFGLFLFYVYSQLRRDPVRVKGNEETMAGWKIWLLNAGGLAAMIAGGRLVVPNAVDLATLLGVSEKIIGVTIVAAGTSLPELATSVVAAIRKNNDMAVGNIIGSNIFNIFFILAISGLIRPIPFDRAFNLDILLLAGGTVFMFLAMFMSGRRKLDRWEAVLMTSAYLGYLGFLIYKEL
ncbi:MAG TPA: calcium/sodium antiporter [Bacteroidales bacterium]|nr:calcium/sodium antiporter [Bacteroidales bacterium]